MVTLDSVRVRNLMMISATDQTTVAVSIRIGPRPTSAVPGWMITNVPAKPIRMAIQRRTRTTSPRNSVASSVAKSGAVKPSAVACANGVMERP